MSTNREPTSGDLARIEAEDPLEALLLDAQLSAPARKPKHQPGATQSTSELYMNPANWERTRGVALVHRDSNTLLGNFSEYRHLKDRSCRKLVREEQPIGVSGIEEVEGSWWLGAERQAPPKRESWHEQRRALMHLHLPALQIHCPAAEIVVFMEYGSIRRAELAQQTMFASEDGTLLIELPAGLNVLEVMDHDGKVKLRMEVGL